MIASYSMLLLLAAAPATAQTTTTASPAVAASTKPVCRREATTGSIMPGKRICHTATDWKAIDEAHAQAVDDFRNQANSGKGVGGN